MNKTDYYFGGIEEITIDEEKVANIYAAAPAPGGRVVFAPAPRTPVMVAPSPSPGGSVVVSPGGGMY